MDRDICTTILIVVFAVYTIAMFLPWYKIKSKLMDRGKNPDKTDFHMNKCRCGAEPKVKWVCTNTVVVKDVMDRDTGLNYEVEIKCPKCGFNLYENWVFLFETEGHSFRCIPDPKKINGVNKKLVKKWNRINPKKCEEC